MSERLETREDNTENLLMREIQKEVQAFNHALRNFPQRYPRSSESTDISIKVLREAESQIAEQFDLKIAEELPWVENTIPNFIQLDNHFSTIEPRKLLLERQMQRKLVEKYAPHIGQLLRNIQNNTRTRFESAFKSFLSVFLALNITHTEFENRLQEYSNPLSATDIAIKISAYLIPGLITKIDTNNVTQNSREIVAGQANKVVELV